MESGTHVQPNRIGKRGAWVVPAGLRRRYGLEEGALVIAEPRPDGILLKPAIASPALTAAATADNAWQEWFDLMRQVHATTEEIHEARIEGQRECS